MITRTTTSPAGFSPTQEASSPSSWGGGREAAYAFLNALKLCVKAPSLGDVYSLAIHPATSSHRELSPTRRERLGVGRT